MSSGAKKNGAGTPVTGEYHFPQKKEKQSCAQIIYNSKEGTYFGRTPKSWGQLLTFYVIFYIVLAGLFAICMQGLFSTLKDNEPAYVLEHSLIGTNPGMGYRPLSEETERGSLIQFDTKKPAEGNYWIGLINDFLKPYNNTIGKKEKICGFNETRSDKDICAVDITKFNNCTEKEGYGYQNAKPCVFLKLNKIYKWVPEYYDNPSDLPDDMPDSLKKHIDETPAHERKQIWVSCDGQRSLDKENVGSIQYYPSQGFHEYYYPFLNQEGYMSPLIAVQFEKLKVNQMVTVECRAWARNIIYSGSLRDRQGSVSFQLLLD